MAVLKKPTWVNSIMLLGLISVAPQAIALTDGYFVTGQDLDMIIESQEISAMEELEYELRKIPLFREVEDFVFSMQDEFIPEDDY